MITVQRTIIASIRWGRDDVAGRVVKRLERLAYRADVCDGQVDDVSLGAVAGRNGGDAVAGAEFQAAAEVEGGHAQFAGDDVGGQRHWDDVEL